ncbi:hypothetical protein NPIL_246121 [Nephila pilipes]|uniref:Uncharacterized protein n=1 Tax=Nephila pilipes TaxID=299642 RepID=A0A8X6JY02_NEPPI|nr:hypothetical protein NPIL_246121 [Nephila pilipes]
MSRPWTHRSTGDSHRIRQKDDPSRKVGQPPPSSLSSAQTMRSSPADVPEDLPAIRRSALPACEGDFQSYGSSAERVV